MFADWLELLGAVLTVLLLGHEAVAVIGALSRVANTTQEQVGELPLTLWVRVKLFIMETMWVSYFGSDIIKRALKVPNYPIRIPTMSFGGLVGYLTWTVAPGHWLVALGAGEGAALMMGLGAMLALRRHEGYQSTKQLQAQLMQS